MLFIRILQFIFFSILLPITLSTTTLHAGPVGISLCRQICQNTIGCEIYTYLIDDLKCLNGNLSNTPKSRMVIGRLKKPVSNDQHHCQPGTRVFRTRKNHQVCREVKTISSKGSETTSGLLPDQLKTLRLKGYHEFKKGNTIYLYKYYTDKRSWESGMRQCKEDGGFLAQLNKAFKWEFVPKAIQKPNSAYMWIGLSDQKKNDKFVWIDGTELKDEKRWFKSIFASEPTHTLFGMEQNCGRIHYNFNSMQYFLFVANCFLGEPFLCEVISKNMEQ